MKTLKLSIVTAAMLFAITTIAQERPQGEMRQRTPEEQAKNTIERLDKQLKLSQTQKDSIYIYALDQSKKQQEIFKNSDDRKAAFEKMQSLRSNYDTKIKSFLNAEQLKSYETLQKEMQERRSQRQRPE